MASIIPCVSSESARVSASSSSSDVARVFAAADPRERARASTVPALKTRAPTDAPRADATAIVDASCVVIARADVARGRHDARIILLLSPRAADPVVVFPVAVDADTVVIARIDAHRRVADERFHARRPRESSNRRRSVDERRVLTKGRGVTSPVTFRDVLDRDAVETSCRRSCARTRTSRAS
jgi:hypothetical protein